MRNTEAQKPPERRRSWVKPKVSTLTAGGAEFNVGAMDDSGTDRS